MEFARTVPKVGPTGEEVAVTETSQDVERLEAALGTKPTDWVLRRILADAYEDAGDELRSAYLRWSAENEKCPEDKVAARSGLWYWWDGGFFEVGSGREFSNLPDGMSLNELCAFWRGKPGNDNHYPCSTMLRAEYALAAYLRHCKII